MSEHVEAEEKDAAQAHLPIHPLFAREIRRLHNWHEWLSRWEAAVSVEEMLGLLHVGFSVSLGRREHGEKEYDSIDRLVFYFAIADGWENCYLLESPRENSWEIPGYDYLHASGLLPSQLRQKIARKAFDMLCLNFFKTAPERFGVKPEFKAYITEISEPFFSVIQNFFRAERESDADYTVIRNLSRLGRKERSHNEQLAVDFLIALAKLVFGEWVVGSGPFWYALEQKKELEERNAALLDRINGSKPWLIEVLSHLDKLDLLRKREWLIELDKPCLAKLKEIALRETLFEHTDANIRYAATVEEALYAGSKAALLLKEYEIAQAEHKRLTAIRDAEQQRTEAEKELERLTRQKK